MGQGCSGNVQVAADTFHVPATGFSIPVRTHQRMGWRRDLPDFRDKYLAFSAAKKADLPKLVDLRPKDGFPIYDQGELGSCTANAIGAAVHYNLHKQGQTEITPSRLFIYYNERALEGSVGEDSGAMIRDGVKTLNKIGVCDEDKLWPYDIAKFTAKPSDECYQAAAKTTAKEYARVPQTLEDMKACLNDGFPFVFGFAVYSSFQTRKVAATGFMSMPDEYDYVLGGHAVMACGYDDDKKVFIVRNSWGPSWGDKGHFYMPFDYLCNADLASDMWAIKFVGAGEWTTK